MRRALFALIVAVIVFDAAGLEGLFIPEPCVSVSEHGPDNDCPAMCVRCSCGQPILAVALPTMTAIAVHMQVAEAVAAALLPGSPHDVLHVPKSVSTRYTSSGISCRDGATDASALATAIAL